MPEPAEPPAGPAPSPPREAVQRLRLVLRRDALDADQQQRVQQSAWEAALVASGLPLAGLDTPAARPRFVLAAPLSAAIPGEAELADVWLVDRCPVWRVRESLGGVLPPGWHLESVHDVWPGEVALPGQVVASVYRATVDAPADPPGRLADVVAALLAAGSVPRERAKADRTVTYDLRPFVADLVVEPWPSGASDLVMELRHDPERGVGRPEEVLAEVGSRLGTPLSVRTLVRERLVLGPGRARTGEPPPRTGARHPDAGPRSR